MGSLFSPNISSPPPPPPPPPAANPPTYASANVQNAGEGARKRMQAAAGAGFEGSLFTGPRGATGPVATTKQQLLGG